MHYLVHESHPFHPDPGPVKPVRAESYAEMIAAANALTGRAVRVFSFPSVQRKLREGNRCVYVAPARGRRCCWVTAHA